MMLNLIKRTLGLSADISAALDTMSQTLRQELSDAVRDLRTELDTVRKEHRESKEDAARVRQGLTLELERARADINTARRELAAVRQEVTKARQESLAVSQSPATSAELDERVATLERMIISKYEPTSVTPSSIPSHRGTRIDLNRHEFGNKVQL